MGASRGGRATVSLRDRAGGQGGRHLRTLLDRSTPEPGHARVRSSSRLLETRAHDRGPRGVLVAVFRSLELHSDSSARPAGQPGVYCSPSGARLRRRRSPSSLRDLGGARRGRPTHVREDPTHSAVGSRVWGTNMTVGSDSAADIVRRVSEDAGVELEIDVERPASRTARIEVARDPLGGFPKPEAAGSIPAAGIGYVAVSRSLGTHHGSHASAATDSFPRGRWGRREAAQTASPQPPSGSASSARFTARARSRFRFASA